MVRSYGSDDTNRILQQQRGGLTGSANLRKNTGAMAGSKNLRRNTGALRGTKSYSPSGGTIAAGNSAWDQLRDGTLLSNFASRGNQFSKRLGGPARQQAQVQDNTQYLKTLSDFMQQARDILGSSASTALSGALSNIGNREAALKSQAATSDTNIGKGYAALNTFFQGNNPIIEANYQGAQNDVQKAAEDTAKLITEGAAGAAAQQNKDLARLGIQDANIVLQNKGTDMAGDTAAATADAAARAQGTRNLLAANQQTAQNFNTASGNAAQLEGRSARNQVQGDLLRYLASLQDQRQEAQAAAQVTEADVTNLAQQLYDQDYQQWQGNYDRRYQVEQDAADRAQAAYEAQLAAAAPADLSSTQYSSLGPLGQASYALQQSGVSPEQSRVIANALNTAYNQGNIRSAADFIKLVQQNAAGSDPIDAANAAAIYYQYFQ